MRRTYKSKKDTTGVLDHKDVLLNLDEKSSAFDAFYIQNIKQIKRDVSCLGASNYRGTTKKVRNRKYVKRIVKVEPIRESLSSSVYMTPEKSIRVNKAPDLFDQLLNSSSANLNQSPCSSNTNILDQLRNNRECKTYTHKKAITTKKYNYSSSESDSDKENSLEKSINITKNSSNINIQKLLIEKQEKPTSKDIDLSICNILEQLPQLNKIVSQRKSNNTTVSFKPHQHRLTKNLNTSVFTKSPLSSTPYREKYRSNSIYNFSPITSKLENSIINKSIIQHDISNKLDNDNYPVLDSIKSPILQSSKNYRYDNIDKSACISLIKISKSPQNIESTVGSKEGFEDIPKLVTSGPSPEHSHMISSESKPFLGFTDPCSDPKSSSTEQAFKNDLETDSNEIDVINETLDGIDTEKSKLQTTEVEPFLGFYNPSPARISKLQKICIEDSYLLNSSEDSLQQITIQDQNYLNLVDNDIDTTVASINEVENDKSNGSICMEDVYNITEINSQADRVKDTKQFDEVLNRTKDNNKEIDNVLSLNDEELNITEESLQDSSNHSHRNETQADCVNDTTQFDEVLNGTKDNDKEIDNDLSLNDEELNITEESLQDSSNYSSKNETNSESSFEVSDDDYDTCTSEQNDSDDDVSETRSIMKYPMVEIERLRQSVLEKYLKRLDDSKDEICASVNNSTIETDNAGNFNESSSSIIHEKETNLLNESRVIHDNIIISSSEGDYVDSNSNDEDKCISFVTTRRRNEVNNDTSIFVLDNTVCSPASSDCDRTVIDIKTENNDKQKTDYNETDTMNRLDNKLLQEWNAVQMERKICKKKTDTKNLRKSSRGSKQNLNLDVTLKSDIKDAIVLQPGKKWERSLSIYRRMTQIGDNFDESLISDDPHKGRNYRQSVINTMENQEVGSVHNVSISSRRSTILSKPSRSTVRIINDTSCSRLSTTSVFDDLQGFLHEDCDDTAIELSKLSIADDREITVVENLDESDRGIHETRGTTARDYVLRRCNQRDVILFDECYPESDLKNCHKIGEGVYGEVYLWRARDGRARVMKIIPIAGDIKVNGECQKDYQEIIAEIVIAMELSALRAPLSDIESCLDEGREVESLDLLSVQNATDIFNEVIGVRCVYGPYPSRLLDLWELYDEVKGSENDNPAILPHTQQYIVLELANAGQDLESYQFNSAEQAHALFWQVAFGLAVGEEAFQLEHRDLHWGNVLISPTEDKLVTFVLRGRIFRVRSGGVRAAIIDYSLSRASLRVRNAAVVLYNDLAQDDSLFSAVGDYQFDVYRHMRDKLKNEWKNFEPSTNILWLHYIVDKMITALRYKRTNTKIHKHYIAKLKGIKNRILQYESTTEFVLTDNEI